MKKIQFLVALAALATLTTGAFAEETMHHDTMHHEMMQTQSETHKLSAESHKPNWESKKEESKEEKAEEMHEKTHPKTNVTREKHMHKETTETKKAPSHATKEAPKH